MWQLFLPFRPPVGLPSGYKCEARGSVCPIQAFCVFAFFAFLAFFASFAPFSHRPLPPLLLHLPSPRAVFPITMAGKSQILPADAWARSLVTKRRLEELVRDGLLRPRASRTQPEWRVPLSDNRESARPEDYVVSFMAFHEMGLGVPPSHFMRVLLHYYKVELHHLAPTPSRRLPFSRRSTRGT
jgi:hypothetical protein